MHPDETRTSRVCQRVSARQGGAGMVYVNVIFVALAAVRGINGNLVVLLIPHKIA